MAKGSVIIVSGPSGVGKGTIVKAVVEKRSDMFLSVSCTTRAPREGEIPGKSYHYISEEEFKKKIEENYFLEWECYVGNYYGTPLSPVLSAMEEGKSTILEIEVGGAFQAKRRYPDAVLVFVVPPSFRELKQRLETRDAGNEVAIAAIEKRMARALEEYEKIKDYDYIIVNDNLEEAIENLETIINAGSLLVKNNKEEIEKIKNN
ncbi:MAG: guanylate kinase [Clostridia bacterium]|nr:guanylate kinase [Clostridia bacterium]